MLKQTKKKIIITSIISSIILLSFIMAYIDEDGFDWGVDMNDSEWEELIEDYPIVYNLTLEDEQLIDEQMQIYEDNMMNQLEEEIANLEVVDIPEDLVPFEPNIPKHKYEGLFPDGSMPPGY